MDSEGRQQIGAGSWQQFWKSYDFACGISMCQGVVLILRDNNMLRPCAGCVFFALGLLWVRVDLLGVGLGLLWVTLGLLGVALDPTGFAVDCLWDVWDLLWDSLTVLEISLASPLGLQRAGLVFFGLNWGWVGCAMDWDWVGWGVPLPLLWVRLGLPLAPLGFAYADST